MMGVYERVEKKEINGRGVWQKLGGKGLYLFFCDDQWLVADESAIDEEDPMGFFRTNSIVASPDQISDDWELFLETGQGWQHAPKVHTRLCSSAEKHDAVQQDKEWRQEALAEAQQARTLLVEGLNEDGYYGGHHLLGEYELVEGREVNERPVWHMHDCHRCPTGACRPGGLFLFYSHTGQWWIGSRWSMESGASTGFANIDSTALTPDQAPSRLWQVAAGGTFPVEPGLRVRRRCYALRRR
jgi:hypothetical protein